MGGHPTEYWVVGVTLLSAAIEGLAISGRERGVEQQSDHQVRIGDEGLAEGGEIGAALRDRLARAGFVEAVIGNDDAAEQAFQLGVVEGRYRHPASVAFDDMEVGEAFSGQL